MKEDSTLGLRLVIRDLPQNQKDDILDIIKRTLDQPSVNPYQGSCCNHLYYTPKIAKILKLLENYGADMERIPRLGG